ncbi:MAG: SseB family protein [Micromonosporaceae bacterium]
MPTSEPNGGPGTPDQSGVEAEYVAARAAEDYVGCVKKLLGMSVWLPVQGSAKDFIVTHRGDQGLVRAYTSPGRVDAVAGPDVDPAEAVRRRFADLVSGWRHPDIGLVINPDSDSEFQLPRRLFDRVLTELRRGTGEAAAGAGANGAPGAGGAAPRTPRLAPIDPPNEIDGFRFATMADDVDDSGAPVMSPERGTVEGRTEKRRIVEYLDAGAPVQLVTGFTSDMMDPSKGDVVPASTRTDGQWIWSDGVGYYLETYGIAPEPDFYRTIVAAGYACPEVSDDQVLAAGGAVEQRQRIAAEMYQRWRRDQPR